MQQWVKHIYPQPAFLDLEEEVNTLDFPACLISGQYDYTCVATIAERWFRASSLLRRKKLLQLENSGHNGIYTEPEEVIEFFRKAIQK